MRLEIEQTGNGANDDAVTLRLVLDGPPARVIAAREFRPAPGWMPRWFTDDTLYICSDQELFNGLPRPYKMAGKRLIAEAEIAAALEENQYSQSASRRAQNSLLAVIASCLVELVEIRAPSEPVLSPTLGGPFPGGPPLRPLSLPGTEEEEEAE